MKVAVSVPEPVFEEAERIAKRLRVSRSRIYTRALEDYVRKHREKGIREALNEVYGSRESELDPLLNALQAEALREEW